MLKAVTVRPVEGRLILMPDRAFQPVPEEGARVHLDAFYVRTINHGDLEVVPDDEPASLTN
jgi:hypothetical protein